MGVNTALLVIEFIHWTCYGMIVVATPALALDLYDQDHSGASLFYGLLNGASALLQFFSNPLYGSLSDSFGRKPFLLISIGGLFVSLGTVAIGMNKIALIVSAITRGMTDCSLTVSYAYLADTTTEFEVTKSYGALGAAVGLGVVIGSGIGAVTINYAFIISCFVSAVNFFICYCNVQEPLNKIDHKREESGSNTPGGSGDARKASSSPTTSPVGGSDETTALQVVVTSSSPSSPVLGSTVEHRSPPPLQAVDEEHLSANSNSASPSPTPTHISSTTVSSSSATSTGGHRDSINSSNAAPSSVSTSTDGGMLAAATTGLGDSGNANSSNGNADNANAAAGLGLTITTSSPLLTNDNSNNNGNITGENKTNSELMLFPLTSSTSSGPTAGLALSSSSSANTPTNGRAGVGSAGANVNGGGGSSANNDPDPDTVPTLTWKQHLCLHWSPFSTMGILRTHPYLTWAAWPFFLNTVSSTGIIAIWLVYCDDKFNWSDLQAGIFVFVVGISAVIVQAFILPFMVPDHKVGERKTIYITLPIHIISLILFGLCFQGYQMYVVMVVTMMGFIFAPTLRGTMVKHIPRSKFGTLQGALASLSSAGAIFGPLLLNGSYSIAVSDKAPVYLPSVPFYIGALLNLIAFAILYFGAFHHYHPHQSHEIIRSSVSSMPQERELDILNGTANNKLK